MADSDGKTGFKIVVGRPTLTNSSPNPKRKGSTDEDIIKAPKSKPQSCRKPPKKSKKEMKLKQENEAMNEVA